MIIINKKNEHYSFKLELLFPSMSRERVELFKANSFTVQANTGLEIWATNVREFCYFRIQLLGFGFSFHLENYNE